MKAFKGFNKDLTCRGYQYEEGKEFHTERAECCDTGFHACEYPLDCFGYYDPAHSVYHEVELSGEMDKSGDNTKVCATDIKIGARLSIAGLVKMAIDFTWRDRRGIIQRVVHFARKDVPLFSILSKNPPQK